MRKFVLCAVSCIALLAFSLPVCAVDGNSEVGETFVSGDFTVQYWQEKFKGGGPGQAGNTLKAKGEDFKLDGAVLESVIPLGGDTYFTTYVGGKLHLKKKGPWGKDLKASDVTLYNESTFSEGFLEFSIYFCGQFEVDHQYIFGMRGEPQYFDPKLFFILLSVF